VFQVDEDGGVCAGALAVAVLGQGRLADTLVIDRRLFAIVEALAADGRHTIEVSPSLGRSPDRGFFITGLGRGIRR
jgi:hypothetical protein